MTTDKQELQRLCDAASSGPWESRGSQPYGTHVDSTACAGVPIAWCSTASTVGVDGRYHISTNEAQANAAFIAAARTAIPELLAELAAVTAERDGLVEALKLADTALSGANMDMKAVERKVKAALPTPPKDQG